MAEDHELCHLLHRAARAGDTRPDREILHAVEGVVDSVSTTPTNRCDVEIDENVQPNLTWIGPHVPRVGARCVVVYRRNRIAQGVCLDFDDFDSLDVPIAETFRLQADDQRFLIESGSKGLLQIEPVSAADAASPPQLEKTALGETLKQWLDDLCTTLTTKPIALDPISGPLMMEPTTIADVQKLKTDLDDILSKKVKNA